MKIAISTDGDYVSLHFGRCPEFTIVDIKNGKVAKKEIIPNPGHSPGNIPRFLHQKNVEVIVAGGMGMRATGLFNEMGIKAVVGVSGKIDEVVLELCKDTLNCGESLCKPGSGKGYGLDKTVCEHGENEPPRS